ncbi:MAG: hypothetical protein N3B68_03045, partial [Anaerolineae bacterium]|nr:hypothetical protein [Anaerolineae bacterium]
MSHEAIAQTVDTLLDILGDLGLPLTGPARLAVRGVESLRRSQEAQRRLAELLRQAEEDFQREAARQGLDPSFQWVASLPLHNLDTFREAVKCLLVAWSERALEERLAQEFTCIPGIRERDRARALALYLTCLLYTS